ncbi:MAG: hypothetical protein AAFV53_12270 [Myxococcota bacterium]
MSAFTRFRSAHGVRPKDHQDLDWHHIHAPSDVDAVPDEARAISIRGLSVGLFKALPPNLEALHLNWCADLDDAFLERLRDGRAIRWLYIDHCLAPDLSGAALAGFSGSDSLEVLAVRARPDDPPLRIDGVALHSAHRLRILALQNHPALADVSGLADLPALEILDLGGSPARSALTLTTLRRLLLDGPLPFDPQMMSSLPALAGLEEMSLLDRRWPAGATAAPFGQLTGLRRLSLRGSRQIPDTSLFSALPPLEVLDLAEIRAPSTEALKTLPPISALRLPGHKLTDGHLAAAPDTATLWLAEGAAKISPHGWDGRTARGLQHLTIDCMLKRTRRHVRGWADLGLLSLTIYRGAEALRPADLAPLRGLPRLHLEQGDIDAVSTALPGTQVTIGLGQ